MKRRFLVVGALSLVAFTGSSQAQGWGDAGFIDEATVQRVTPVYTIVRVEHPRQQCWHEDVVRDDSGYRSKTPLVVGGILGGAVGHSMGAGRGKDVATIAGVLLGASIANDIRNSQPAPQARVETREVCRTVNDYSDEKRVEGYDVTYRYRGHLYTTRMDRDPGPSVRVRVSVAALQE